MKTIFLGRLRFFEPSRRLGFSGRQALSEKHDLFYSTIQGIVSAAIAYATAEDGGEVVINQTLTIAHVVFPVVIVDAPLFEAYFEGGEVKLDPRTTIQLQWRGSDLREAPVLVDIVSAGAMEEYVESLANQAEALLYRLRPAAENAVRAIQTRTWKDLQVQPKNHPEIVVPELLIGTLGNPKA